MPLTFNRDPIFSEPVTAVTLDPKGHYYIVTLQSGLRYKLTSTAHKAIVNGSTLRPDIKAALIQEIRGEQGTEMADLAYVDVQHLNQQPVRNPLNSY